METKSIIDLRPMDFGDIFDGAIRIYRRSPLLYILVQAVLISVPLVLLQISSAHVSKIAEMMVPTTTPYASSSDIYNTFLSPGYIAAVIFMIIGGAGLFFLQPIAQAAMIFGVSETILGHEVTWRDCIARAWPKAMTIITAYVRYMAIVCGLIALLVLLSAVTLGIGMIVTLPAMLVVLIFYSVKFLFLPHVIMLENVDAPTSLRRSGDLSVHYFWRIFWINFVIGFIVLIISYMLASGVQLADTGIRAIPGMPYIIPLAITGMLTSLVTIILNPIQYIAVTLLYYDMRIRKEGFDLLYLASAVAGDMGFAPIDISIPSDRYSSYDEVTGFAPGKERGRWPGESTDPYNANPLTPDRPWVTPSEPLTFGEGYEKKEEDD